MVTKKKPGAKRGRPKVPIEQDPDRFKLAMWRAFYAEGFGMFDAARLALLATDPNGGPITIEAIEKVYHMAATAIPLPSFDPLDPDKGLRQLSAKAKRTKPTPWLASSAGLLQGLIEFIRTDKLTGIALAYDGLLKLGWGPVIMKLADRIETALRSNLAPADLEKLSPAVRRLLAEQRQQQKK